MDARDWAMFAVACAGAVVLLSIAALMSSLFRVSGSLKTLVDGVRDETVPLIGEVTGTVRAVNKELERVDAIVGSVQTIAYNAQTVSETVRAAVTNPLVKALAFMAGARRAARSMRED